MRLLIAIFVFLASPEAKALPGGDRCHGSIFRFSEALRGSGQELEFEETYPKESTSARVQVPKLYRKVMNLFRELPSFQSAFPDGIVLGTPYAQLLQKVASQRNRLAHRLRGLIVDAEQEAKSLERSLQRSRRGDGESKGETRRLAQEYRKIAAFISTAASRFELQAPGESAGIWDRLHWDDYQRALAQIGHRPFEGGPQDFGEEDGFYHFSNRIRGIWANLRVALCVPQPRTYDVPLGDGRAGGILGLGAVDLHRVRELGGPVNVDVVFEDHGGVLAWGEVKSSSSPLRLGSRQYLSAVASIDKMVRLREQFNAKVRIHLFMVDGLQASAYTALRQHYAALQGDFVINGVIHPD